MNARAHVELLEALASYRRSVVDGFGPVAGELWWWRSSRTRVVLVRIAGRVSWAPGVYAEEVEGGRRVNCGESLHPRLIDVPCPLPDWPTVLHVRGRAVGLCVNGNQVCTHNMTVDRTLDWREVADEEVPEALHGMLRAARQRAHERARWLA